MSLASSPRLAFPLVLVAAGAALAGCSAAPQEQAASTSQGWDSQGGNPTHATHSHLTETAVDALSGYYPELATYKWTIVDGANQELHELPLDDPEKEALRQEADGTNWACNHPEVVWQHARDSYAAGDTEKAYWYLGIVLHWVEDMGVPAHSFHVYHQGSFSQRDNFEMLGLARWSPSYDDINNDDPGFTSPSDYVAFSGAWTQSDFQDAFPGVTYGTRFFPATWVFISDDKATFFHDREGRTATVVTWALQAAVDNW
jgi:hypothetical protein